MMTERFPVRLPSTAKAPEKADWYKRSTCRLAPSLLYRMYSLSSTRFHHSLYTIAIHTCSNNRFVL